MGSCPHIVEIVLTTPNLVGMTTNTLCLNQPLVRGRSWAEYLATLQCGMTLTHNQTCCEDYEDEGQMNG